MTAPKNRILTTYQFDNLVMEMDDKVTEMHEGQVLLVQRVDAFLQVHEKCQALTCKRLDGQDKKLDQVKRDGAAALVAVVIALIGVIAILI